MADKFITLSGGGFAEQEAITSSAGAGDAGKIPALDGTGRFDSTMMPVGIGDETKTIEASENLGAGDLVNIYNSSGEKCRKADASNSRTADGFVLTPVTSGQNATVFFPGNTITGLSSLTPGEFYYLSDDTAGDITTTAPTDSGHIVQNVGKAISDTELLFNPQTPITRA